MTKTLLLLSFGFFAFKPAYCQLLDETKPASYIFGYKDAVLYEKGLKTLDEIKKEAPAYSLKESTASKQTAIAPLNDDCSGATLIVIGAGDYSYNNTGATYNATDPLPSSWTSCTAGPVGNVYTTVWFKFVVTGGPKNITVSSQGSTSNSSILKANYAVFSGTCGALTQIGTSLTGSYGNYDSKRITLTNLANGTYYIMTDPPCNVTGRYSIRVDNTPATTNSLWYPSTSAAMPTLLPGISYTQSGQWGTFAADGPEAAASCQSGLQFSDWYSFTYDPLLMTGIHITDQAAQAAFFIGLYDASGTEIVCNKYNANLADASFTWDLSSQVGSAVHMPNIGLQELGLTSGAKYYIRVSNSAATRYNVNDVGDSYTIQVGTLIPSADCYLNLVTRPVTIEPLFSWLNGQTNLRASHSMKTEPEAGNSGIRVENSLMYRFNSGTATSAKVYLRNISYYSYSNPVGQIAILTAAKNGTTLVQTTFTASTCTLSVNSLIPNTDYWILIDGGGSYAGTKLTFDMAITTISPLAVELLSFKANLNGANVDLNWETASEKDNDYFTIERSPNGNQFNEIGRVKGSGSSSENHSYAFTDLNPLRGTSYYRLKETTLGGLTSYGPVKSVTNTIQFELKLIDNSLKGASQLRLLSSETEPVLLELFEPTGRKVAELTQNISEGINQIQISGDNYAPGIYYLKISSSELTRTEKIIISR